MKRISTSLVICFLASLVIAGEEEPLRSGSKLVPQKIPLMSVNATATPSTLCYGDTCQLSAVVNNATGIVTYAWTSNPVDETLEGQQNQQNPKVIPEENTVYTVEATDDNGPISDAVTVTVNPRPVPTISGPNSCCHYSTENTYTTESGKSNYVWTVSSGGVITAGVGANIHTAKVTWNSTGAQWVKVNYDNQYVCSAVNPTKYDVTVNPLPSPNITGPSSACVNSMNNTYTTEATGSGYQWSVSSGGTITSGLNTNSITVTWNTPGSKTVSVNYSNTYTCTAASPTNYSVTVHPLPTPGIVGPTSVCRGAIAVTYATEQNMTNYTWSVPTGGTITGGSTTFQITVNWNSVGSHTVSVNYITLNGCTAATPSVKAITVNELPSPTINGLAFVCAGTTGVNYSTEPGMTNYNWLVPTGGTITAGSGTNEISVTWNTAGSHTVSVNYTDPNLCSATTPTVKSVLVHSLPNATISGNNTVCQNTPSLSILFTGSNGSSPYTFTYTINAGSAQTISTQPGSSTVSVNASTASPGIFIYNLASVSDGNGCSQAISGQTATITINPNSTIGLTSAPGTNIQNVDINNQIVPITYVIGGGGTGANVVGLPPGVTSSYNSPTNVLTIQGAPTALGSYAYTVTTTGGYCQQANASGTIYVNDPTVPLSATVSADKVVICNGETVQLYCYPQNGVLPYSFQWSSNPSGFQSTTQNPMVNPATTTTYSCKVTDSKVPTPGIVTASVTITVNPMPQIYDMTGGGSYCAGDPGVAVGLSGSQLNVNYELFRDDLPTGIVKSGTGSSISFGMQTVVGSYSSNATFATSTCSRIMNGSKNVLLKQSPQANAGPDIDTIAGVSVTIDQATDNGTGISYLWTPIDKFINNSHTQMHPTTVELSTTLVCTFEVTNSSGCKKSDEMVIFIEGTTLAVSCKANNTSPLTICKGNSVQLSCDVSGGAGSYTYNWKSEPSGFATNIQNPEVNPDQTTNYIVTVKDAVNNEKTCNVNVIVNPLPAQFNVTGGGGFCEGDAGKELFLDGSTGGIDYSLLVNNTSTGITKTGNTGSVLSFGFLDQEGTYTVRAKNPTTGCENLMNNSALIAMTPKVITQAIHAKKVEGKTLILIYPVPDYKYRWEVNNTTLGGEEKQYYIIKPEDLAGDKNFRVYVEPLTADPVTGLYCGDYSPLWNNQTEKSFFFQEDDLLLVYPNPARDIFTLIINESLTGTTGPVEGKVLLNDLSGKRLASWTISDVITEIPVNNFIRGIYLVQIEVNGQFNATRKLIIL